MLPEKSAGPLLLLLLSVKLPQVDCLFLCVCVCVCVCPEVCRRRGFVNVWSQLCIALYNITDPTIHSMNIPPFTCLSHLPQQQYHSQGLAICVGSRRNECVMGGGVKPKWSCYTSKYNVFSYQHIWATVRGKYSRWSSRPARLLGQGSWMAAIVLLWLWVWHCRGRHFVTLH